MRRPNPETHQACRSLLQKAVRRGNVSLMKQVVHHLRDVGDIRWLRRRAPIIAFEECWPLASKVDLSASVLDISETLTQVAQAVKMKDAAGLGSLAYALSLGDSSVFSGSPTNRHIRVVSKAIERPDQFWRWISAEASVEPQHTLVVAAQGAHRRGGWPWDMAFVQAAAYLAVVEGLPAVEVHEQELEVFPFWVALDKHTPQGKAALREAATSIGLPWRQLSWICFYLEGARTNASSNSVWWSREIEWRLGKVGLSIEEAESIWYNAQAVVSDLLREEAERLREHIRAAASPQLELL